MLNAIVSRGEIRPVEPLPDDWLEGQALCVEKAEDCTQSTCEIDRDFAILEGLCAASDLDDDLRLDQALRTAHALAKEYVRRSMGNS